MRKSILNASSMMPSSVYHPNLHPYQNNTSVPLSSGFRAIVSMHPVILGVKQYSPKCDTPKASNVSSFLIFGRLSESGSRAQQLQEGFPDSPLPATATSISSSGGTSSCSQAKLAMSSLHLVMGRPRGLLLLVGHLQDMSGTPVKGGIRKASWPNA